eukprot:scaffold66155_cov61-Phaeocystis_antarctica.AAC.3
MYKGHAHLVLSRVCSRAVSPCGGKASPHEAHIGRDAVARQRVHHFARHRRFRPVHLEHIGVNLNAWGCSAAALHGVAA